MRGLEESNQSSSTLSNGTTGRRRSSSILENQEFFFKINFPQVPYWSDDRWKACLAAGGGSKRRYQYCSDISGTIVYLLIPETKGINILHRLTSLYHVVHNTCTVLGRKIKTRYFWVDIILAISKRIDILSDSFECNYPSRTLPAYCIPKVVRLKTGEVLYEKSHMSPRPPPTISLRHDHDWTRGNDQLGSTVEQQPVVKLVQQSCGEVQHEAFSQPTQPKPQPICDRSGKPDSTEDVCCYR